MSILLDVFHEFHVAVKPSSAASLSISGPPAASSSIPSSFGCNNSVSQCNNDSKVPHTYYICHCRLGHPSETIVKIVFNKSNLPKVNKSALDFCATCCFGKSHRLPCFPSTTRYDKPFQLLFLDLWGPAPM